MQYVLLFLEGIITFISPCLLPMLPIYLSFFAASEVNRRKTLSNALAFVIGFTLIFVMLGVLAGSVGKILSNQATLVNIVTGLIVLLFGLHFLGLLNIRFLNQSKKVEMNVQNLRFSTSLLFGMVFSIGWTPCVGAFLGTALMSASQNGEPVQGAIMLLIYSLGLGIPFVLSALLMDMLKGTFDFIKRNYQAINRLSGCLLVLVGIAMMTGFMNKLFSLLTF